MAEAANPKPGIFMSHAYADNTACLQLASALEARGHSVWLDLEQDYIGQEIPQVVREALIAHDVLLIVVSEASLQSKWVNEEYSYFASYPNRGKRKVVPVKVSDCHLSAEPILALETQDTTSPVALDNLAAIDATRLPLDEVIARIEQHIDSKAQRWGRTKLSTLREIDFAALIHELLPAIYGTGNLAAGEKRLNSHAGNNMIDVLTSNSYTLFPGHYIIELKAWGSLKAPAARMEAAITQIILYMHKYGSELRQKGIDGEVFGFLLTSAEVPDDMRAVAIKQNIRIFDGPRLLAILRNNGFDVEL
jgi:hypothetical protein